MRDIEYLIVPDVHGRDFWKSPVEETLLQTTAEIVFLGDYLDPYPYEWTVDTDCRAQALDRFKQILELKKQNRQRVTLLLGNHDCGYAISDAICSDRMDRGDRRREIERLFLENRKEFLLAKECDIAGKHFIFSHAGILKGWADLVWGEEMVSDPEFNVVDSLNTAWTTDHYGVLDALGHYDLYRGWGGFKYGSPVWSDIRSWTAVTPEETFGFNICGHTQVKQPLVLDQICDLDCRKAFYLDGQGDIRDYDTGEKLKKTIL